MANLQELLGVIIKGSLDEKLPSYGILKMRENSKVEKSRVEYFLLRDIESNEFPGTKCF